MPTGSTFPSITVSLVGIVSMKSSTSFYVQLRASSVSQQLLTVCLICAFCFPVVLRRPTLTRARITVLLVIKPLSSLFRCLSNLDLFKLTKLSAWLNLDRDLDGQLWESEQSDNIIFLSWLPIFHLPPLITSATVNISGSKLVSAKGYRRKLHLLFLYFLNFIWKWTNMTNIIK